jgi:hypothetical protein
MGIKLDFSELRKGIHDIVLEVEDMSQDEVYTVEPELNPVYVGIPSGLPSTWGAQSNTPKKDNAQLPWFGKLEEW